MPDRKIIASGNLAAISRTIMGVLGQFALLQVAEEDAVDILTGAGLPARALQEPDFPIALGQELNICMALVRSLSGHNQSPAAVIFGARNSMGIEHLGVLGMAMRHAATAVDALKVCLAYPQLSWGHSRMTVSRHSSASVFSFAMERPRLHNASEREIDKLMEYCLALDLVTSLRNIEDLVESGEPPLYINFPFPMPQGWQDVSSGLPYPIYFSRDEACLAYPATIDDRSLPHSNPLLYRSYVSIAERLAQMLAEDFSLGERVTRWLWAYTPPPKRGEIARLLSMSERNLTRKLGREGTSYADLLAQVQQERAKNFLRNPTLSIAEISYRLGYSEAAAFSRAFTNWTGESPLRWRKGVPSLVQGE